MAAAARMECVMAAKRVTERVEGILSNGIVDAQPRMITSVEPDVEVEFEKSRV